MSEKDIFGNKYEFKEDKNKPGDKLKFILKANWIFTYWYEKLILMIILFWAIISFFMYVV